MRTLRKSLNKFVAHRSLRHLQNRATIVRFHHNFVKTSQQGRTPAELAGVRIPCICDPEISNLIENGSPLERLCFFLNLALATDHVKKALRARLRYNRQK